MTSGSPKVSSNAPGKYVDDGCTVTWLAVDGKAAGFIALSDTLRPDAEKTVAGIRDAGVSPVLLTGDHENAARFIAGTDRHNGRSFRMPS